MSSNNNNNNNSNNNSNNMDEILGNIRRNSHQQRESVLSLPRRLYDDAVVSSHRPSMSAELFALIGNADTHNIHRSSNAPINTFSTADDNNNNNNNSNNSNSNKIDESFHDNNTGSSNNNNNLYLPPHRLGCDRFESKQHEQLQQPNNITKEEWRHRKSSLAVSKQFELKLREAFRENQRLRRTRQMQHFTLGKGLGSSAETTLHDGRYIPQEVLSTMMSNEETICNELSLPSRQARHMEDDTNRENKKFLFSEQKKNEKHARILPPICPSSVPNAATVQNLECDHSEKVIRSSEEGEINKQEFKTSSTPVKGSNIMDDEQRTLFFSFPFMREIRCRQDTATCINDIVTDVESNLLVIESELHSQAAPFTFEQIVESVSVALRALSRGHLRERVELPLVTTKSKSKEQYTPEEESTSLLLPSSSKPALLKEVEPVQGNVSLRRLSLHGAIDVLNYVQSLLLPMVYKLLPTTHAVRWVLEYTITFLRCTVAQTQTEAHTRASLLARCVRYLGTIEHLSARVLSLESTIEEYDAFDTLRHNASEHLTSLLDDVERMLRNVLQLPFPLRRARLEFIEAGIHRKLQRVLLFLHEIDHNWSPTVHYHARWRRSFLSGMFARIHSSIVPLFLTCTLGFVDETLYSKTNFVLDHSRHRSSALLHRSLVPRACQVEAERVNEHFSYAQVAMSAKSIPSYVLGLQLCLSARYVVRQATREFDRAWGFVMHEKTDITPPAVAEKLVSHVLRKAQERLRTHTLLNAVHSECRDDTINSNNVTQELDDNVKVNYVRQNDNNTENNNSHTDDQDDDNDNGDGENNNVRESESMRTDSKSTTFLTQGNFNEQTQVLKNVN